jgi:hypothetical protein
MRYWVIPQPNNTSHVLTSFVSTDIVQTIVNRTTYHIAAVCPNYSTADTSISAPVGSSG